MLLEVLTLELQADKFSETCIEFENLTASQVLQLSLALNNRYLPTLTQLSLSVDSKDVREFKKNLAVLTLNCPNLTYLKYSAPFGIHGIDLSKCTKLNQIFLNHSRAQFIALPYYATSLVSLDISDSQIRFLNLNGYCHLKELNANNSALNELHISDCNDLRTLNLSDTGQLEYVNIHCETLQVIQIKNSALESIDFSKCHEIKEINIHNTKLKSLGDLGFCTELTRLIASSSSLQLIPSFSNNHALKLVNISDVRLSRLAVMMLNRTILSKLAEQDIKFIHNHNFATEQPNNDEFANLLAEHFNNTINKIEELENKDPRLLSPVDITTLDTMSLADSIDYRELKIAFADSGYLYELVRFKQQISARIAKLKTTADRCTKWLEYPDIKRENKTILFSEIEISDLQNLRTLIYDQASAGQIREFLKKINGEALDLELLDLRCFNAPSHRGQDNSLDITLKCTKLHTFRIDSPCIKSLNLDSCGDLQELCLQNNKIPILPDLSNCKRLIKLDVMNSQLSALGVFALHKVCSMRVDLKVYASQPIQDFLNKLHDMLQTPLAYTDKFIEAVNVFQNHHIDCIRKIDIAKLDEYYEKCKIECALLLKLFDGEDNQKYLYALNKNLEHAFNKRKSLMQAPSDPNNLTKVHPLTI